MVWLLHSYWAHRGCVVDPRPQRRCLRWTGKTTIMWRNLNCGVVRRGNASIKRPCFVSSGFSCWQCNGGRLWMRSTLPGGGESFICNGSISTRGMSLASPATELPDPRYVIIPRSLPEFSYSDGSMDCCRLLNVSCPVGYSCSATVFCGDDDDRRCCGHVA